MLFDLPESPAALTAADTARVFSTVAWSCEQVFVVTAGWLESISSPEAKVSVSVAARVFGWHAAQWRALIPESVLLEDDRAAAPGAAAGESVAALVRAKPQERVDALRALAAEMGSEVDLLTARLSPVSDGAATRLATFLQTDLGRLSAMLVG
ncbi:MAG: hypothetical protein ABIQ73_17935 [Acidimicrobiales bacterium]